MGVLKTFIGFLDLHSGSLTFLITFVYVVATIVICRANIKSAVATREQVSEQKKQFEDIDISLVKKAGESPDLAEDLLKTLGDSYDE